MVFWEHFTEHNQAEVKTDLQFLIEQQCFETKSALKNFKQEVSTHFSDEKLTHTIQQLFQTVTGQRDEWLCNEQATPAHDFLAQLCLIRCWFGSYTKIDSDFWARSQQWVQALKKLYNTTYKLTPFKPIEENGKADSEFFKAVLEIIAQSSGPTRIQRPIQSQDTKPSWIKQPHVVTQATINKKTEWIEKSNNKEIIGKHLDERKVVIITDPKAQTWTIENFIPQKGYPIVLNYAHTNSAYKQYTSVVATRNWSTYVVQDPHMPHGKNNRALIYPNIQVKQWNEKIEVANLTPNKPKLLESKKIRLDLPILTSKIDEEFAYAAQNKRAVQFKPQDVIDACKQYSVPINYFLAVSRNDSNHWTNGKARSTKNPWNYWNTDTWGTVRFKTRRDGVFKLAEHLAERVSAYQETYWPGIPAIEYLMKWKGPNWKQFFRGVRMTASNWPKQVKYISEQLNQSWIPKTYIPEDTLV